MEGSAGDRQGTVVPIPGIVCFCEKSPDIAAKANLSFIRKTLFSGLSRRSQKPRACCFLRYGRMFRNALIAVS